MSLSQRYINQSLKFLFVVESLFPQTFDETRKDHACLPPSSSWCRLKRHLCRPSDRIKGSYSIEAAVALPVFMGFVVCILFFIRMVMIGWAIDTSLSETVDTMAVCDEDPSIYAAGALFYGKLLSSDVKLDGVVLGGPAGVILTESSVDEKDITLTAAYRVNLPIASFLKNGLFVYQKKSARIWNGYDPHEGSDGGEYVYVTPYGVAYHRSLDCPYINPSIRAVARSSVSTQRNSSAHRYGACPMCKKKAGDTVYITSWGECYHGDISCSGLKRTLNEIRLDEAVLKYHACPKCGGG